MDEFKCQLIYEEVLWKNNRKNVYTLVRIIDNNTFTKRTVHYCLKVTKPPVSGKLVAYFYLSK